MQITYARESWQSSACWWKTQFLEINGMEKGIQDSSAFLSHPRRFVVNGSHNGETYLNSHLRLPKGEQDSQIWMPTCDTFWVPNEIKSWNFQHMLHLWFLEASQNLSLFRQHFFHSFQGGTKGKMLKNCRNYTLVFQDFSFGNYEKKSCLNDLKFLRGFTK